MNHYWSIPGDEVLHESTESHGASSEQNPLVQLDPGLFIWTILTFLLLLMVLAKFAWKPLLEMLDERQKSIDDSLLSAEKARIELAGINIVSKAKEEADGQLKKAKNQISVEKDRALLEIRQEVVELSITVAEKIIKKNLSKDDNASIIEDSLNKLDNYEA